MRSFVIAIFMMLAILASGCQSSPDKVDEVVEINLTKAWKSKRTVKLSELVKRVEYLKVVSDKNSFMQRPQLRFFGQKYILF